VLGGERYDQLVEKVSGVSIPATGFGLGFDRTLLAAEQFNLIPKQKPKTKVLMALFNSLMVPSSLLISRQLRKNKISCDLYPDPQTKLEKQMKYADKNKIPWVIILGPEEKKKNKVTLKNLKTKKQEELSLEEVIIKISNY
jgi:histidyl-tRNA synthetase